MTQPIIRIENLSVAYRGYAKPVDFLKELVLGGIRHDTFWALRNINLDVREGERVGIIGPNGAGKSTLLQTIAGSLTPTQGSVTVDGAISSLLSLVPAWNMEDSGIENIEFNLRLRGMDRRRIAEITEEIIEFTDIGPFIYNPVKTYSSGMGARLSFAIATAIDPDILIIDEVLGTGDGYFAGRATRRLQEMCARGRALLFVSHANAAVRMLCDRCIWIENGTIRMDGSSEHVVRQYEEDMLRQDEASNRAQTARRIADQTRLVTLQDVDAVDEWLLRIRPAHGRRFTDTHYIYDITISVNGVPAPVPLEADDVESGSAIALLDTRSCEWGRMFERAGRECRLLLSRSGMRPGGYIRVRKPAPAGESSATITLDFRAQSILSVEQLTVEYMDLSEGVWKPFAAIERSEDAGWCRYRTGATLAFASDLDIEQVKARASLALRKPVEITSLAFLVAGQPAASVLERRPFEIVVELDHHERMPSVNVSLSVIRSDGVYVFYQPSGLDDRNITDYLGRSRIRFNFDDNPFGAGEYEVNVFVTEGFYLANCPPQDILDRSIGVLRFRVDLARPIPFGLVNTLARVSSNLLDEHVATGDEALPRPLAFPPPYRRMLAINSDVEWTDWPTQRELLRIFADHELETAFTYWFFGDPRATWRLYETDGRPAACFDQAAVLIGAGLLDTNHSYGGVSNGGGTPFGRREIARAAEHFARRGLSAEVYSNHGGLADVQNVGGSWCSPRDGEINAGNYQQGDVPDSASYHLDITKNLGARYFWLDIDCVEVPWLRAAPGAEDTASLFESQVARDGTPMLRFRRSNVGKPPLPDSLAEQLNDILGDAGNGYQVLYNHFGFRRSPDGQPGRNPPPYFTGPGFAALDRLAAARRAGDVLVTTTQRLLGHALVHLAKPWTITRDHDVVTIRFNSFLDWNGVRLPLRWRDLDGFTIPAEGVSECRLILGIETRQAEFWTTDGIRYAGIRWRRLPMADILAEIA